MVSAMVLAILCTIKYKKYPKQISGAIIIKNIIGPIILNKAKNIWTKRETKGTLLIKQPSG